MVYKLFLAHSILEGGVSVASIAGLAGLIPTVPLFPWTGAGGPTAVATAELASVALLSFGTVPYLTAYLTSPVPQSSVPLAIGAAMYHVIVAISTALRLADGKLPVLTVDGEAGRMRGGGAALALHAIFAWRFVAWVLKHNKGARDAKKGI
ncbi:hypothetical protein HK101_007615 [Irineochytrium annulatum]|nr:hypothetical protein HK101_007615 [Irineochytrium annulatum]